MAQTPFPPPPPLPPDNPPPPPPPMPPSPPYQSETFPPPPPPPPPEEVIAPPLPPPPSAAISPASPSPPLPVPPMPLNPAPLFCEVPQKFSPAPDHLATSHHGNHPAPPTVLPHGNFESNERSRSSLPQLSVEQQLTGSLGRLAQESAVSPHGSGSFSQHNSQLQPLADSHQTTYMYHGLHASSEPSWAADQTSQHPQPKKMAADNTSQDPLPSADSTWTCHDVQDERPSNEEKLPDQKCPPNQEQAEHKECPSENDPHFQPPVEDEWSNHVFPPSQQHKDDHATSQDGPPVQASMKDRWSDQDYSHNHVNDQCSEDKETCMEPTIPEDQWSNKDLPRDQLGGYCTNQGRPPVDNQWSNDTLPVDHPPMDDQSPSQDGPRVRPSVRKQWPPDGQGSRMQPPPVDDNWAVEPGPSAQPLMAQEWLRPTVQPSSTDEWMSEFSAPSNRWPDRRGPLLGLPGTGRQTGCNGEHVRPLVDNHWSSQQGQEEYPHKESVRTMPPLDDPWSTQQRPERYTSTEEVQEQTGSLTDDDGHWTLEQRPEPGTHREASHTRPPPDDDQWTPKRKSMKYPPTEGRWPSPRSSNNHPHTASHWPNPLLPTHHSAISERWFDPRDQDVRASVDHGVDSPSKRWTNERSPPGKRWMVAGSPREERWGEPYSPSPQSPTNEQWVEPYSQNAGPPAEEPWTSGSPGLDTQPFPNARWTRTHSPNAQPSVGNRWTNPGDQWTDAPNPDNQWTGRHSPRARSPVDDKWTNEPVPKPLFAPGELTEPFYGKSPQPPRSGYHDNHYHYDDRELYEEPHDHGRWRGDESGPLMDRYPRSRSPSPPHFLSSHRGHRRAHHYPQHMSEPWDTGHPPPHHSHRHSPPPFPHPQVIAPPPPVGFAPDMHPDLRFQRDPNHWEGGPSREQFQGNPDPWPGPPRGHFQHEREMLDREFFHPAEGMPVPMRRPPLLPAPPPVIQKVVAADTIFDQPGRSERPSHIVIILRGLPGSGKTHLAKLMKEKEAHYGAPNPRILSIDSYFLNEVEKVVKDPDTGRRVKRKFEEYEYDEVLEPAYHDSMFKLFQKTLCEGYFNMIIVDAVNNKISHFDKFWSAAKMNGFEAFVVDLDKNVDECVENNIHSRTEEEILKLHHWWEATPAHFTKLDVTPLLSTQTTNINEVDMDTCEPEHEHQADATFEVAHDNQPVKSRWEQDISEDRLDKLDGVRKCRKRAYSGEVDDEEELTLSEYLKRKAAEFTGVGHRRKKRVRWADLEAARVEEQKKRVGFTIGREWKQVSEKEVLDILHRPAEDDTVD